jgi:hypothetical protein
VHASVIDPQEEARMVIARIAQAVFEYRDDLRAGIVRARNRLAQTMILTGLTAYALVVLAILMGVDPGALATASAYYLVGAVVGLFDRLRTEAQADSAVEDYGLAFVRLVHTPLVSGLAAVGGVVLMALIASAPVAATLAPSATPTPISSAANSSTARPSSAASSGSSSTQVGGAPPAATAGPAVALRPLFDIPTHPVGLLLAAIFGLSPGLLVQRLQNQAERYKDALRNTELS